MNNELDTLLIQNEMNLSASLSKKECDLVFHVLLNSMSQKIWNLVPPVFETMPEDVSFPENLQKRFKSFQASYLRQSIWLKQLSNQLKELNTPVILLKGHGLNGDVYSSRFPRLSVDVDLLVQEENFESVSKLIGEKAFSAEKSEKHTLFIIGKPYYIQVELHWRYSTINAFQIDFERVWNDSYPHPAYDNGLIRRLSYEDDILQLIIHGYNHLKLETYMKLDLIRIVNSRPIDWQLLESKAKQYGCFKLLIEVISQINNQSNGESKIHDFKRNSALYRQLFNGLFDPISSKQRDRWKPLMKSFLHDRFSDGFVALKLALKMYFRAIESRVNLLSKTDKAHH